MRVEEIKGVSPAAAFLALRRLGRPFIFSGSAEAGKRYSYAGAGPTPIDAAGDPFAALSKALGKKAEAGPFPFTTGAVAYFSYDLKSAVEPRISFRKKDGPGIPLFMAGLYDPVFVYDHREGKGYLASRSAPPGRAASFRELLEGAPAFEAAPVPRAKGYRSDTTREEYISAVGRAKEYIASGDIYQINLSHRLTIEWAGDPFSLYMKLLETHPAPMSSYHDFGPFQVISNSPESLMRVEGGAIETCPIKGTRKRGRGPVDDNLLIGELRGSRKERAEHVMIVDLERNDLGKVCLPGSVEVSSFEEIVSYPHLHHMVSTVRGALPPSIDSVTALRALFPGGSITGAPKVRAMEIIDELERSARSIYTGAVGWFDRSGGAEVAVAIRTAVCMNGLIHLSVGGGIVADSDPADEYEETMLKAQDFLRALGVA